MADEVFVNIRGFEGLYMISNKGKVMSCPRTRLSTFRGSKYANVTDKPIGEWHWKPRILSPIDSQHRLQVNLHDIYDNQHRFQVSHLVADHFILNKLPHPIDKRYRVSFKDGDYHNCAEDNIIVHVKRD